jgi:hypothetical protein
LAVVEELAPGRDGEARLVKLKTASGVLLRPIQRVYPLELQGEEPVRPGQMSADMAQDRVISQEKDNETKCVRCQTRSGRKIKLPSRFRIIIRGFHGNGVFVSIWITGLSR